MAHSIFPAADAAGVVFGVRGNTLLTMFGVFSVGAVASILLMSASRMGFAFAREGRLPPMLSKVASNGTPVLAVAFIAAIASLFIGTGSYIALATTTTTVIQFTFVAAFACVFALRKKEPELERPYRTPLYP